MGEENTKNLAFKLSFSFFSYSHQLAASHNNLAIPTVLKHHIIFTALNFVIILFLKLRKNSIQSRQTANYLSC